MYTLTVDRFNQLDPDQRGAIARYITTHLEDLGVSTSDVRELRFTPAVEDDPSLIEARISDELEHDDGTWSPAGWACATNVPEPPALHRWLRPDELEDGAA